MGAFVRNFCILSPLFLFDSDFSIVTYRPDIDGLRAISILLVVIFHAFPSSLPNGFLGVDVFFVISGFLIACILLSQLKEHESINFGEFYTKRVLRLFPSLLFVVFCTVLLGWLTLTPSEIKALGTHTVSGILFFENILLINEASNYFDTSMSLKPLMHLWSLSIEEQFYLIYPFVLYKLRKSNKAILVCTITTLAISLYFNYRYSIASSPKAYFSPLSRAWELMLGCLAAYIYLSIQCKSEVRNRLLKELAPFLGISLIVFGVAYDSEGSFSTTISILFAVLGAATVILLSQETIVGRVLSSKWLVHLGKLSYPLYLWHWVVLSYFRIMESEDLRDTHAVMAICVSIILAQFTYTFIENKFKTIRKEKMMIIGVVATSLVALGITTHFSDGYPNRKHFEGFIDAQNKKLSLQFSQSLKTCRDEYPTLNSDCHLSNNGNVNILIIGDSHAEDIYPGLANISNHNVMSITMGGCQALAGELSTDESFGDCRTAIKGAINVAVNSTDIHTVILTSFYENASFTGMDSKGVSAFKQSARDTLDLLIKHNKKVVYVLDRPKLDRHIRECLSIRPFRLSDSALPSCDKARSKVDDEMTRYNDLMSSILSEYTTISIIDSIDVFCTTQECFAKSHEQALYRDNHHLSLLGSTVLAEAINTHIE